MRIALRRIVLALLVALSLAACGTQAQPIASSEPAVYQQSSPAVERTDFVVYSDATYPFSLQLPRAWYAGELSSASYGIVASNTNEPGQPRAAISVIVETLSSDTELDQAISAAEASLRANVTDFRMELDRAATVNGSQGRERHYRFTSDGQAIRQRTVYLQGEAILYAISLTAPQAIFAQHEAIFNTVLTSFKGS